MIRIKPTDTYAWPPVRGCDGARFLAQTMERMPSISGRIAAAPARRYELRGPWLYRRGKREERPTTWRLKAYLCVASREFWEVAEEVLFDDVLARHAYGMKIFFPEKLHPKGLPRAVRRGFFRRPDKVVVYANDAEALRRCAQRLAELRGDAPTHTLAHAARADQLDLVPAGKGRGIYVGLDPAFLDVSWRVYRAICLAFLRANRTALRTNHGSTDEWLVHMNISRAHGGPQTLTPDPQDHAFVRRQWRSIVGRVKL